MIRQIVNQFEVRNDPAGDGHYGARRGDRKHKGIDFLCEPQAPVLSPVEGVVTKYGYCYGEDLRWRYVEITTPDQLRHRLFYVEPTARFAIGDKVTPSLVIGYAQDISVRYPGEGMLAHIHYEVKDQAGKHLDPEGV